VLESPTNATGDFALLEASGLVVSRGTDNGTPTGNRVLWTIQDHSNNATRTWLYANLPTGATRGYYELGSATGSAIANVDWEDMSFYRDSGGTNWLYIADIGDNNFDNPALARATVTIYRFAEPAVPASGTTSQGRINDAAIQRIVLRYPVDAPTGRRSRDAEALAVDPSGGGDIYIASKREPSGANAGLYRAGTFQIAGSWRDLTQPAAAPVTLSVLGDLAFPANTSNRSPSAIDISPNGMEVVVKSDDVIKHYVRSASTQTLANLLVAVGTPPLDNAVQIVSVKERHNRESIAFAPNGRSLYTVSEASDDTPAQLRPVYSYTRGTGVDVISGGNGNDQLHGGLGNDTLNGDANDDYLYATLGTDTANGGNGTDRIIKPGDLDVDGDVDKGDLAAFLHHFGTKQGATWQTGDLNDDVDGKVSVLDLIILRNNMGSYVGSPPAGGEGGGGGGGDAAAGSGKLDGAAVNDVLGGEVDVDVPVSSSSGGGAMNVLTSVTPARVYFTTSGSLNGGGVYDGTVPDVTLAAPGGFVDIYVWVKMGSYNVMGSFGLDIVATNPGVVRATSSQIFNPDIMEQEYDEEGNPLGTWVDAGDRWNAVLREATLNPDGDGAAALAINSRAVAVGGPSGINRSNNGVGYHSLDALYDPVGHAYLAQVVRLEAMQGSAGQSTDIVLYQGSVGLWINNDANDYPLYLGAGMTQVMNHNIGTTDGSTHATIAVAQSGAPGALTMSIAAPLHQLRSTNAPTATGQAPLTAGPHLTARSIRWTPATVDRGHESIPTSSPTPKPRLVARRRCGADIDAQRQRDA
jgi:hypothetical protein